MKNSRKDIWAAMFLVVSGTALWSWSQRESHRKTPEPLPVYKGMSINRVFPGMSHEEVVRLFDSQTHVHYGVSRDRWESFGKLDYGQNSSTLVHFMDEKVIAVKGARLENNGHPFILESEFAELVGKPDKVVDAGELHCEVYSRIPLVVVPKTSSKPAYFLLGTDNYGEL